MTRVIPQGDGHLAKPYDNIVIAMEVGVGKEI